MNTSVAARQEANVTTDGAEVEKRWGLPDLFDLLGLGRTGCSANIFLGHCVHLRQCQPLLTQVRANNLHPGRIFERLQEFTQPCPLQGHVCCPERRQEWNENPWAWTNSPASTRTLQTRPVTPPTTVPYTTVPPKTTKNKIPIVKTKTRHKNRRLLPEADCGVSLGIRIIGGKETALEEHPWMAYLRFKAPNGASTFGCGGSIISARYVLTAAHCISGIPPGYRLDIVRVGEHNTGTERDCQNGVCNGPHQDVPVQKLTVHPQFTPNNPGTFNDIALIRLQEDVVFNRHVTPICLPLDGLSSTQNNGRKLTTVGWGRTTNGVARNSPIKLKVDVPVVANDQCAQWYLKKNIQLANTQMCAGGIRGADSCSGDSGGPLLSYDSVAGERRWHIQGIVSFGPKDCGTDTPAVYTRVNRYLSWILDNIHE